jgi:hypothetical protein
MKKSKKRQAINPFATSHDTNNRRRIAIVDSLTLRLLEEQQKIAAGAPGHRYPTLEEATLTEKLIGCVCDVSQDPGLPFQAQAITSFVDFIASQAPENLVDQLRFLAHQYIDEETVALMQYRQQVQQSSTTAMNGSENPQKAS